MLDSNVVQHVNTECPVNCSLLPDAYGEESNDTCRRAMVLTVEQWYLQKNNGTYRRTMTKKSNETYRRTKILTEGQRYLQKNKDSY